jgi:hypothetical protein
MANFWATVLGIVGFLVIVGVGRMVWPARSTPE